MHVKDNANFEMACHIEGPIVDSLYDMALISWFNKLEPPLPSVNSPSATGGINAFSNHENLFGPQGELKGANAIIHPQKIPLRQAYGREKEVGDQPTGPSTTESIVHPGEGGGQGSLTPKGEQESTPEHLRKVGNPFGNQERGADSKTGQNVSL